MQRRGERPIETTGESAGLRHLGAGADVIWRAPGEGQPVGHDPHVFAEGHVAVTAVDDLPIANRRADLESPITDRVVQAGLTADCHADLGEPTRAEHRWQTLLALSAATTEELETKGLDATIDDIANRAGVARRTVYRWVDSREDLVFIHPRLWIEVFDDQVKTVADQPLRDRVLAGSRAVSEHVDADPEPVIRAMHVALAHPSLMRGYAAVSQEWVDRMAREVLGDRTDDASRFRARVLGAALMGVIDAALTAWMTTSPRPTLISLVESGLDYLAPILDEPEPA